MHILHVNTEKGWRGGERQTLLSMEGLRRAGVDATLLCLRGRPLHRRVAEAGFPVVAVGSQLSAAMHLLLSRHHYSVIHAQSSRAFGIAAAASLVCRTPVVYTRRVDFSPKGVLTRWKYGRASALVAISGAIRDILQNAGMGSATVISSIVTERQPDIRRSEALRKRMELGERAVVGIVAAMVGHKDPLTAIRAAARVHVHFPEVVFLHFGDGPLRNEVEHESERLGMRGVYLLAGYQTRVEDFFPLFSCFVMSSQKEGLGSSVLDAFKYGVPVASTTAGGLAELVEERGLTCAPRDPAALAENIIRLLTDRKLAGRLKKKAFDYVVTYHSCTYLTGKYIELYRRIIPNPSL